VNATLEKDKPKEEASTVPKLPAEDQVTFQYLPINSTGGNEGKGLSWFQNNTDIVGDTQILLSVGGYTWSKHFSAVCGDAGKRKKFVDSSVELVKKYDLAGIGELTDCRRRNVQGAHEEIV
jgi:GH18 family chitinase